MRILVDTSVWSEVFRRRAHQEPGPVAVHLTALIRDGRAVLIGPIRQEILSGLKNGEQFERLKERLRAFPDIPLDVYDYELAAEFSSRCRAAGVQGSSVDFLICAVAVGHQLAVFTSDRDFVHFSRVIPVALHELG